MNESLNNLELLEISDVEAGIQQILELARQNPDSAEINQAISDLEQNLRAEAITAEEDEEFKKAFQNDLVKITNHIKQENERIKAELAEAARQEKSISYTINDKGEVENIYIETPSASGSNPHQEEFHFSTYQTKKYFEKLCQQVPNFKRYIKHEDDIENIRLTGPEFSLDQINMSQKVHQKLIKESFYAKNQKLYFGKYVSTDCEELDPDQAVQTLEQKLKTLESIENPSDIDQEEIAMIQKTLKESQAIDETIQKNSVEIQPDQKYLVYVDEANIRRDFKRMKADITFHPVAVEPDGQTRNIALLDPETKKPVKIKLACQQICKSSPEEQLLYLRTGKYVYGQITKINGSYHLENGEIVDALEDSKLPETGFPIYSPDSSDIIGKISEIGVISKIEVPKNLEVTYLVGPATHLKQEKYSSCYNNVYGFQAYRKDVDVSAIKSPEDFANWQPEIPGLKNSIKNENLFPHDLKTEVAADAQGKAIFRRRKKVWGICYDQDNHYYFSQYPVSKYDSNSVSDQYENLDTPQILQKLQTEKSPEAAALLAQYEAINKAQGVVIFDGKARVCADVVILDESAVGDITYPRPGGELACAVNAWIDQGPACGECNREFGNLGDAEEVVLGLKFGETNYKCPCGHEGTWNIKDDGRGEQHTFYCEIYD